MKMERVGKHSTNVWARERTGGFVNLGGNSERVSRLRFEAQQTLMRRVAQLSVCREKHALSGPVLGSIL